MADEFDDPILPVDDVEDDISGDVDDQPEPAPAPVVPDHTQVMLLQAQNRSNQIMQQILEQQGNRQRVVDPGPQFDPEVLATAAPLVKAVLKERLDEIEALKNEMEGFKAHQRNLAEGSFIRAQVPDFDAKRDQIAAFIHQQCDAMGVPRSQEARVGYFTPVAIVAAAAAIGATAAKPPTPAPTQRPFVEGRGQGTQPSAPAPTVDYLSMSDADFAKMDAKIAQQRMSRNRG